MGRRRDQRHERGIGCGWRVRHFRLVVDEHWLRIEVVFCSLRRGSWKLVAVRALGVDWGPVLQVGGGQQTILIGNKNGLYDAARIELVVGDVIGIIHSRIGLQFLFLVVHLRHSLETVQEVSLDISQNTFQPVLSKQRSNPAIEGSGRLLVVGITHRERTVCDDPYRK